MNPKGLALPLLCFALTGLATRALAQDTTAPQAPTLQELEARIDELEARLEERTNAMATALEQQNSGGKFSRLHIGGYGELHLNSLTNDDTDEDFRQLDFHRFVLYVGYDFSDRLRFVSELEVEHVITSASNRGAVELEQAYIEYDLAANMHLRGGLLLMPLGIISETHEPPTFYGVERPIIETTIIPTTWYVNGVHFINRFDNGFAYDLMVSEGFKTEDPNADASADPFDLKAGKQKGSFAAFYDPAVTLRLRYTGITGLELAVYAQHQPDIDQSAETSYADAATFVGGHVVYQLGDFTGTALAGNWSLDGDAAEAAGRDTQNGGYLELSWRPWAALGFFARHSAWSLVEDVDATQTDFGLNYYPHEDVVLKADYQVQNDDAGGFDGFNLGLGYQF